MISSLDVSSFTYEFTKMLYVCLSNVFYKRENSCKRFFTRLILKISGFFCSQIAVQSRLHSKREPLNRHIRMIERLPLCDLGYKRNLSCACTFGDPFPYPEITAKMNAGSQCPGDGIRDVQREQRMIPAEYGKDPNDTQAADTDNGGDHR